ncbi:MAG TPA: hypothetical protein VGB91_09105 [Rhizomicrobium sp.]
MAILTFLFRWRAVAVGMLVVGTAAAAFLAFRGQPVPVGALFLSALSIGVGVVLSFLHLRHVLLALLVVVSPLPGMIAAAPAADAATLPLLLAVYGFGYAAAAFVGGEIVSGVLSGACVADAARAALVQLAAPITVAALSGAALLGAWLFRVAPGFAFGAAGQVLAAALSVLVVVPFGASVMAFGETFFTAGNRAREGRDRLLRVATRIVEPRWGMSLSGVALVFAVLGWFGAAPLLAHSALLAHPAFWPASALGTFLVAYALARDWREAAAATAALAALTLLSLWLWGRTVGHLTPSAFAGIVVTAATAATAMLALAGRSRAYRRDGDDGPVARLRALEQFGAAAWFAAAGAGAVILPWMLVHGSLATLAVLFVAALAAAVVAAPAIATALEAILPHRRSVDELYGRR